ncbi:unnamed protein product [Rotaria magnacalcarata]|uniref:Splicing factor Cactin n=7 Tax=Rotaria magnacalcarata TaxID=392030 RepID=A0A814ZC32_9BILA|nr:unnamed protein product [Rotaria magnacalcarata]CAF1400104.1 unnamed protein product [Rotaria magnacalcarata]CAF2051057.1 unnamed protein product [Rotaria magnacalcarata]
MSSIYIIYKVMGHSKHKKHHRSHHRSTNKSDDDDRKDRSGDRRQSSPTSSSSNDSTGTGEEEYREKQLSNKGKTMEEIEEERQAMKAEKKRQRELRKVYETSHEKRQRRLAKKMEKEKKKKTALGWDAEHMGMTNANNPYGDEKLLDTFVWEKKLQKKGLSDVPAERLKVLTAQRVEENKIELEKLKKQRLERESQKEAMEKEKEFLQRIKEAEYYREWEKQEDSFHYNQVRLRSKIRIADGRAKPIDLLAHYINDDDDDLAVEMHEPSTYLNGLTIRDLEDLLADIRVYTELEQQQKSGTVAHNYDAQYWQDITTITEDELAKLKKLSSQLYHDQRIDDRREGINAAVFQDVTETFKNKTPLQLEQLEQRIRSKIENEKGIDIAYWESLLSQLQAHMARARLRDRHQLTLKRKLQKIKQEQGIFHAPSAISSKSSSTSTISKKKENENNQINSFNDNDIESNEDLECKCLREYEQGRYSPILFNINDLDLEVQKRCTDETDDWEKLKQQRESVIKSGSVKPDVEDAFEAFARSMGSLTADDTMINTVVPMDVQYLWSDKYRPRKPRVFNKVHTGYDWNQYNKKHYDTDNPPPKTVQGYKFNIFYPDLIDKTKTPSYSLTVCEDNRDFSILKFHAGPPYEDIAFKIVSKEWDYSYKHGFRCHFQNGIFQLWFHFRKWKYRR